MTESMSLILALIGTELVVLLFALLLLSWFSNRAARRRDAKAIQALVARVRQGKADRETVLRRFLEQRVGLSGEALTASAAALLRAELTVLHRFAGVYRNRDSGSAALFDIDVQAAVEPYHALSVDAGAEPVPTSLEVEVDTSEIIALREENARLSDELKITMETMSRMLNEYSTMFSGGEPDDLTPIGSSAGTVSAVVGDAGTTQSSVAEPETDSTPDDEIEVVVHEESASAEEASGEATAEPNDDGGTYEKAMDELADSTVVADDAARPTVAGPDSNQTPDEEIDVVVDAEAPRVEPAAGADAMHETARAQGDVDKSVEPVVDDDREIADTGQSPDAFRPSLANDAEVRDPPVFDDREQSEAAVQPAPVLNDSTPVEDSVHAGEAGGLFSDDGATAESSLHDDKGADVEAVSEMLVAGDSELLPSEGALFAEPDDTDLFDDEEALFDELGPQAVGGSPEGTVEEVDAFEDIDDLFDTENPTSTAPEKASQGNQ